MVYTYGCAHQLLCATYSFLQQRIKVNCTNSIFIGLLLVSVGVVLERQPMGIYKCMCISEFFKYIIGSNMALYINNNHYLYYDMVAFIPIMLGCSYFTSPDHLVTHVWTRTMLLYSNNNVLVEPNISQYFRFFPGVVRHMSNSLTVI